MRRAFVTVVGTLLLIVAPAPARADKAAATPTASGPAPSPPATPSTSPDASPPPAPPAAEDAPPSPPLDPEEATRAAAREIAKEGLALFDAGQHAEALHRFERAGALVAAPTMGLMAARSLEKLGRLVEASERYLAVTRMTLAPDASDAFRDAQSAAAEERAALLPRVPSLRLALTPASPIPAVTLDGKPVAPALLGAEIPLDPGPHVVVATSGAVSRTERILLREREARRLDLSLVPPPPPPGPSALTVASWAGVAAGTAGVVLGAIAGGLAVAAKSDLDAAGCANALCPESQAARVGEYNTLVILANAGIAGGLTLGGAGALGLGLPALMAKPDTGTAPQPGSIAARPGAVTSRPRPIYRPWIGPAGAGVTLSF